MRSPGYVKCSQWISEIWHNFDSELIIKSFICSGITTHNFTGNDIQLRTKDLHSVLVRLIVNGIFNTYVDDDIELAEADDLIGIDHEDGFFDQIIESSPDTPESSPDTTETSPDTPETSPDIPETSPDIPETSPDTPETSPVIPESIEVQCTVDPDRINLPGLSSYRSMRLFSNKY